MKILILLLLLSCGVQGKNGSRGIPGQKGDQGEPGLDGADGADGKDGKDGINVKDIEPPVVVVPPLAEVFQWPGVSKNNVDISFDKWFSHRYATDEFFQCMKKKGVDYYIATFNANLANGKDTRYFIDMAKKNDMRVAAYYAWSRTSGLSDENIDFFMEAIKGSGVKTVFIDIEMPATDIGAKVLNLFNRVCHDYECGIYTNYWGMKNAEFPQNSGVPLSDMPLWFADNSESLNPLKRVNNFYGWEETSGRQSFMNKEFCGRLTDVSFFKKGIL